MNIDLFVITNANTTAVIPAPDSNLRGQAAAGIQLKKHAPHSGTTPKGIFQIPKIGLARYAEIFNKLDSRLRGNDGLEWVLACRDSADTTRKFRQRAVAGCA